MNRNNINYAIRYIQEFYKGSEINELNIRAVQGFPTYKTWLEETLKAEGKWKEPKPKREPFEPVFTFQEAKYDIAKQEWLTNLSPDFKAF